MRKWIIKNQRFVRFLLFWIMNMISVVTFFIALWIIDENVRLALAIILFFVSFSFWNISTEDWRQFQCGCENCTQEHEMVAKQTDRTAPPTDEMAHQA